MQNSGWGLSRSVERGPHKLRSAFMDPDDRAITALQCSRNTHSICLIKNKKKNPYFTVEKSALYATMHISYVFSSPELAQDELL